METLLTANALLVMLVGVVVLSSQWRARENQLLFLSTFLDAGRDLAIAAVIAHGEPLTSELPMHIYLVGRILIVYPVLEFAFAFPSGAKPSRAVRILSLAATGTVLACAIHPRLRAQMSHWSLVLGFFVPFFLAIVWAMRRNIQGLKRPARGARWVLYALCLRFSTDLCTQVIVRFLFPSFFPVMLFIDAFIGTLSYALLVYALLDYHLFRVRKIVAQGVLHGTIVLVIVSLGLTGIELVEHYVEPTLLRRLLWSATLLIALLGGILVRHFGAELADRLFVPLDAQRHAAKDLLESTLRRSADLDDITKVLALTTQAIETVTQGQAVLWNVASSAAAVYPFSVETRTLPDALIRRLRERGASELDHPGAADSPPQGRGAVPGLEADALLAVSANRELLFAYAVRAKNLDQDILNTAVALADNLGVKLAQWSMRELASNLESQLQTAQRMGTLGSIAAAVAHDIRTPLTTVKMNLQMVRAYQGISADVIECADMALHEVARLNEYVNGILDYAKPIPLRPLEFELRSLIEETERTVQPVFEARKLSLECAWTDERPLVVCADAVRLKQVLVNLLENAAEASSPGMKVRLEAKLSDDESLLMRVIDHGPGIAPANRERVFEPFFTTRESGTGLGLSIVRKFVRAHEGEVTLETTPGGGSTFQVVIPRAQATSGDIRSIHRTR